MSVPHYPLYPFPYDSDSWPRYCHGYSCSEWATEPCPYDIDVNDMDPEDPDINWCCDGCAAEHAGDV